jgi:hypothetical protein
MRVVEWRYINPFFFSISSSSHILLSASTLIKSAMGNNML